MTATSLLDPEKIAELLKPGGHFTQFVRSFEARPQQQEMLQTVVEAFNQDRIALIEAGTGTGKSLAYLIPAVLWAVKQKQRTIIATHTITLQEQLLFKDIPIVTKALNVDIKAVLAKGMNNYLCLRKLEEASLEKKLFPSEERDEIERIEEWADSTLDGSKSSLNFLPSAGTWEKVSAESDTCTNRRCPYYEKCHFFKARKEAEEAHIIIANHHLLFADLANDNAILPQYHRVILDEAHHIEDVATEYFASKASRYNMLRIVGRLQAEKGGRAQGKLPLLKQKILDHYRTRNSPAEITKVLQLINIDLPPMRHDLLKEVVDSFDAFYEFLKILSSDEGKHRLHNDHQSHQFWHEEIAPAVERLIQITQRYVGILEAIESHIKELDDPTLKESTQGVRFEIDAMATRLAEACLVLSNFVATQIPDNHVRWVESHKMKTMMNTWLVDAKLDIAATLRQFLFEKFSTVILTSATLTTNKEFTFMRSRLGLTEELSLTEKIFDSPFDYQQQTLFAIPKDMPPPSHPDFRDAASDAIFEAVKASRGNAFVLFTSYSMMSQCHRDLEKKLKKERYIVFKQGDMNRKNLLEQFKKTDRSVLFGTDSFWEGVDVVGDALRCVIIAKLPFKVPSEPIVEARTEAIEKAGGDPFWEYSLPNAIVKFKQGFGRLIRNKKDRGCVVCLDTRLLTRNYGKLFLNSLPACRQIIDEKSSIWAEMRNFYKKTYFLTKS